MVPLDTHLNTNRLRPISIVSPSPKGWRPLTDFVSTLTAPCIGSTKNDPRRTLIAAGWSAT
jgi:hypothetical protein